MLFSNIAWELPCCFSPSALVSDLLIRSEINSSEERLRIFSTVSISFDLISSSIRKLPIIGLKVVL